MYALFGQPSAQHHREPASSGTAEPEAIECNDTKLAGQMANPSVGLARCFLHLANLPNLALDRLSRYETTL